MEGGRQAESMFCKRRLRRLASPEARRIASFEDLDVSRADALGLEVAHEKLGLVPLHLPVRRDGSREEHQARGRGEGILKISGQARTRTLSYLSEGAGRV